MDLQGTKIRARYTFNSGKYNTKAHRATLFDFTSWDKAFAIKAKNSKIPREIRVAATLFNKSQPGQMLPNASGQMCYIPSVACKNSLTTILPTHARRIPNWDVRTFLNDIEIDQQLIDSQRLRELERIVLRNSSIPKITVDKISLPTLSRAQREKEEALKLANKQRWCANIDIRTDNLFCPKFFKTYEMAQPITSFTTDATDLHRVGEIETPKPAAPAVTVLPKKENNASPVEVVEDDSDIVFLPITESDVKVSKPKPKPKPITKPAPVRRGVSFIQASSSTNQPDAACVSSVPQPKKAVSEPDLVLAQKIEWVRHNLFRFPKDVGVRIRAETPIPEKPNASDLTAIKKWKAAKAAMYRKREIAYAMWMGQPGHKLLPARKVLKPEKDIERWTSKAICAWNQGTLEHLQRTQDSDPRLGVYVPSFAWAVPENSPYKKNPSVVSKEVYGKQVADRKRKEALEEARKLAKATEEAKAKAKAEAKAKKQAKKPKEVESFEQEEKVVFPPIPAPRLRKITPPPTPAPRVKVVESQVDGQPTPEEPSTQVDLPGKSLREITLEKENAELKAKIELLAQQNKALDDKLNLILAKLN